MSVPVPICLSLDKQEMARAFSRACAKTGKRMAASIAIIAMTTSNSMRVNALNRFIVEASGSRAGNDLLTASENEAVVGELYSDNARGKVASEPAVSNPLIVTKNRRQCQFLMGISIN